jgi:phosphoribosylamine--glycine ligase
VRVLVVGGGGREHALAWQLKRDDPSIDLLAAPGNPGIALLGGCVPVGATDVPALLALARERRVDLSIVGPEASLDAGIVDRFRAAGLAIFGPTRRAARIETSKSFAKSIMLARGVPTARAETHTDVERARAAARALGAPLVIKASGLAAGKGAVVCATLAEADETIDAMLRRGVFGAAGLEILVEEFMHGEELSIFAITDGDTVVPMLPAQDHKRLLEQDRGPNTGGMGAYAPVSIATDALVGDVVRRILLPTLDALAEAESQFTGLLYAGLMLTADGPKVVEFNCRFGDPETQALLPLLDSGLLDVLAAVARGERLRGESLAWNGRAAVTTVLAAAGYPDAPRQGDAITLPPPRADVHVFHAGTALSDDGTLVTAGGRVLAVTAVADTIADAQRASARAAEEVRFAGKQFRADIGWRELARRARREARGAGREHAETTGTTHRSTTLGGPPRKPR